MERLHSKKYFISQSNVIAKELTQCSGTSGLAVNGGASIKINNLEITDEELTRCIEYRLKCIRMKKYVK